MLVLVPSDGGGDVEDSYTIPEMRTWPKWKLEVAKRLGLIKSQF